ncbi:MAG: ATP synthase subunit I [Gammaproteobacteria bacterium]
MLLQITWVAVTSAVFLAVFGIYSAVSVGYGGGIAATNGLVQLRCLHRDAQAVERSPQQSVAAVYVCVIQRFVLAAVLFALGLGVLELEPLAVLAGFVAGQIALVISGINALTKK